MTPNRVTVGLEKYSKKIPPEKIPDLRRLMENATDSCYDDFMYIHLKSQLKTILFSIFLGGLGVDRFYVGDNGAGAGKLIFGIVVAILSLFSGIHMVVALFVFLLSLIRGIWCFVDIFRTYKVARQINYFRLSDFLKANRQHHSN